MQLQKSLSKSSKTVTRLKSPLLRKELNKNIDVVAADYLDELRLKVFFSDKSFQIIDFKPFFLNNPQFKKYSSVINFKKFKIEDGLLVWGKDWELVFPTYSLYQGTTENYNEDDGLVGVYLIK